MTTTKPQTRRLTCSWECCGPCSRELRELAERVSDGVHVHRPIAGSTDEQIADRVAEYIAREFQFAVGDATGAGNFSFSACLID